MDIQTMGATFARITATYATDYTRNILIKRLKEGQKEALPELRARLERITLNSKGLEKSEAARLLEFVEEALQ